MAVELPAWPAPQEAVPRFIDAGGVQRGGVGGVAQKLNRLGDHWAIDVTMPVMDGAVAREWVAKLVSAQREGGIFSWPQPDFNVGVPGAVRVNGGGQSGMTLIVDGAAANYPFEIGQFLSLMTGGHRFLYNMRATTIASAGGVAALPIQPMIRKRPADNDLLELAPPKIEGFILGDQRHWNLSVQRMTSIQFTIEEAE